MPRSSKIAPVSSQNVENSDDEADQVAPPPSEPVKKSKKERTPAQQEAFKKALQILKEKREMKKKDEVSRYEKANEEEKAQLEKEKYEKAKNHKKKLPPAPSYVTTVDLDRLRTDILSAIPKFDAKPVELPKKEVVVEKPAPPVVEKKVIQAAPQKALTGHDLLDKLFFS